MQRISRGERRRLADHAAARSIRPSAHSAHPTILLLGNSLLLEGLDYEWLQQLMRPRATVVRFAVESTGYLEWYFGLRRLFSEGSRPDVIILCLTSSQLVTSAINSDYAIHYLLQPGDITAAGRALRYDLTRTSSLFFAQYSLFYARRNAVRSALLEVLGRPYSRLIHTMATRPSLSPPGPEVERIVEERLRNINRTATSYGGRFALLAPPGFGWGETEIQAAAARTEVRLIIPFHSGALPDTFFSDGFHLNRTGARVFTEALARELSLLTNTPR